MSSFNLLSPLATCCFPKAKSSVAFISRYSRGSGGVQVQHKDHGRTHDIIGINVSLLGSIKSGSTEVRLTMDRLTVYAF